MSALFDLVGAFIDGAARVPFLVWVALVVLCAAFVLAIAVVSAEYTTDEQREQIARAHRELRGTRGMSSTRSTAPAPERWNSPLHLATRGRAATAHGRGRPRRAR